MRIIGLTGGTGSGKSTVASRFETSGIPVVDADAIGHELIAPDGAAVDAVVQSFGENILTGGIIDRAKLGAVVFSDSEALKQLNNIVHPALFTEVGHRCAKYAAAGEATVIVDAALLAEGPELEAWLDDLIVVECPAELRVHRLVSFRGISEADARQRIAAQKDPSTKKVWATWLIDNSGNLETLNAQVDIIVSEIHGTAS